VAQVGGNLIPTYGTRRTAISHVSKNFRGDPQPGKVAMPRGPHGEKRPAGASDRNMSGINAVVSMTSLIFSWACQLSS
jgi:hypothetical protein